MIPAGEVLRSELDGWMEQMESQGAGFYLPVADATILAAALRSLQQQLDEARKESAEWQATLDIRQQQFNEVCRELRVANRSVASLREALRKYGKHTTDCPKQSGQGCNCGLEEAVK